MKPEPDKDGFYPWDGTVTAQIGDRYDLKVGRRIVENIEALAYHDSDGVWIVFEPEDDDTGEFHSPEFIRPHGPDDRIGSALKSVH